MRTYIEIVHVGPKNLEYWRDSDSQYAGVARRILALDKRRVHYVPDELDEDLPNVPKNTPIRVGGAFWEMCVHWRVEILERNGFTNVKPDRRLSIS